jgi:hypothetical protein
VTGRPGLRRSGSFGALVPARQVIRSMGKNKNERRDSDNGGKERGH